MAETMKIRAVLQGGVADVKLLIPHPMETGQRKNEKGELVPMHFITRVTATHNGKPVFDAQLSQGIARNPFVGFRLKGVKTGDRIVVSWVDNRGEKGSGEARIEPG
jgi:sulfur-oxidizing protein SoxZ